MKITLEQLKQMNIAQLGVTAEEIRAELIHITQENGGHLASNLGAVELTVALHYVFSSPVDKLVFDVGHQCYTHKLLTGRDISAMRTLDGVSGFPNFKESQHDPFTVGHSSTAMSTGLGLARARDLKGEDYHVVTVVGDGAFGGGMSLEALNDIGYNKTRMLIVLNDNEMSISPNVGAISRHLVMLRTSKVYVGLKKGVERFLKAIPLIGSPLLKLSLRIKNLLRYIVIGNTVFDNMGIKYLGMVDGHKIPDMLDVFERAKRETGPVLIHVLTTKGKGFESAEKDPTAFHGVSPCHKKATKQDFTSCFGQTLVQMAQADDRICAITAGMTDSTGLRGFADLYPERFFDVGIAEQHALGLAAGLAKGGMRPFVCIYSTFLLRGADQVFQEICLQELPVVLCIDRAGFVGEDGETHQGVYDIGFLRQQDITIMAPANNPQLAQMLHLAMQMHTPCAIRYPKGVGVQLELAGTVQNRWQTLRLGSHVAIIAFGAMLKVAMHAAELLAAEGVEAEVVNACYIKPVDITLLSALKQRVVCVLEDNVGPGGLGEAVLHYIGQDRLLVLSGENGIAVHADVKSQREASGLSAISVKNQILNQYL